jgi:hypothetical protein
VDYSFPHYLLAKQSVDDRALNRTVLDALTPSLLGGQPLAITEVGAGIGTMLVRLLRWGLLPGGTYTLVDELAENTAFAAGWLPQQAAALGLGVERLSDSLLRLDTGRGELQVQLVTADALAYAAGGQAPADLLVAHAFLDLLPLPTALPRLLALLRPGGLAWLTINFDGVTTLEPVIAPLLDARIEQLYHASMDSRPGGGDSRSGRHLFAQLEQAGCEVCAAGASDWVVYGSGGRYPHEEAYFLHFILHFFEQSLTGHPALDQEALASWLSARRAQVAAGQLIYIAHQMDFLAQLKPGTAPVV